MYLLDTNCISELRKQRLHGAVLAWFDAQSKDTLAISSVVLYELHNGANRTRRQDSVKAAEIEMWVESIQHWITVLPFGAAEARLTAFFMNKKASDLLPDAMIAATAATYDLTVATRNTRDFVNFPVRLLNPFTS
jgi:predicted nucleic acid-binding protein